MSDAGAMTLDQIEQAIEKCMRHYEKNPRARIDALNNVIRNAIGAVDANGAIDITLRDGTLTFADTGSGISADAIPDLFTPFFTTKREGRGLALTIVQEILTNHDLTYALRSAGRFRASRFEMSRWP